MTRRDKNTHLKYYRADGSITDFDTLAKECGASIEVVEFIHEDNRRQALQERYDKENADMRFEMLTRRAEEHGTGEAWAYVPSGEPSPEDAILTAMSPVPSNRDLVLEATPTLTAGQQEFVHLLMSCDYMRDIAVALGTSEQAVHSRFLKVTRTLRKRIAQIHPESMSPGG